MEDTYSLHKIGSTIEGISSNLLCSNLTHTKISHTSSQIVRNNLTIIWYVKTRVSQTQSLLALGPYHVTGTGLGIVKFSSALLTSVY